MSREIKNEKLPNLRFHEFSGKWTFVKLGEVCEFTQGVQIPSSEQTTTFSKGFIRYLYIRDFFTNKFKSYVQDKYPNKIIEKDEIMMVNTGNTAGQAYRGVRGVLSNNSFKITFNRDKINGDFLFTVITDDLIQNQIKTFFNSAGQPHLGHKNVFLLSLAYPSFIEQQKIADCLSSLDELITAQSQKLLALKDHKKGLMQQLFPAEGETVPELRFEEFMDSGKWEKKQLGTMTEKVGSGSTPLGGESNYKKSGRPFVRSQNIGWGIFLIDDIAFIDENTHQASISTEITKEDVLLNITGASIGRCSVANAFVSGGNVNQHVCIIRTIKSVLNPYFLNQYLISANGQKQIDSFQAGGNRQGLNFPQIRSFAIPSPPKNLEQQKIADCLSSLDELITAQIKKIEQLKVHKKGLMQQLFPAVSN